MASYDRKCSHLSPEESSKRAAAGESHTIRFKAPTRYPEFRDLLHGHLNLQVQVNPADVRFDDPVLVKSDGLPTYHLANVVDDHLMLITHVVRGEEWLPSTPKHVAMYNAFGWTPPSFVHIPLLTSAGNKKLSKRSGDIGVLSLAKRGVFPEAMLNYVALYGWSPHREGSEVFTLSELEKAFSLDGLTKGNAKVDEKKLEFLNKHFFKLELENPDSLNTIARKIHEQLREESGESDIQNPLDISYIENNLSLLKNNITSVDEYLIKARHLHYIPNLGSTSDSPAAKYLVEARKSDTTKEILKAAISFLNESNIEQLADAKAFIDTLTKQSTAKKPLILQALRYALTGSAPGIDIPTNVYILGKSQSLARLERALTFL